MALSSLYTELALATRERFAPKVVDNLFKSNPIFSMLRKRAKVVPGGQKMILSSLYGTAAAQFIGEWDTVTAVYKEEYGAGSLDWKLIVRPIIMSRLQILQNQNSDTQTYDLVKLKNIAASKALADTMGNALFALDYTVANSIDSLDRAVNDQTGSGDEVGYGTPSYASITRAATGDGATWRSFVDDTTTALSVAAMNRAYVAASEGDETPNLIAVNNKAYTLYYNQLTPIQREGAENLTGMAGFQALLFNGKPVVIDSHVPSSDRSKPASPWGTAPSSEYVYFFNMNHIELQALKGAFFEFEEVVAPYDRLVHIGRYFAAMNVGVDAPRFCAKMTAIVN